MTCYVSDARELLHRCICNCYALRLQPAELTQKQPGGVQVTGVPSSRLEFLASLGCLNQRRCSRVPSTNDILLKRHGRDGRGIQKFPNRSNETVTSQQYPIKRRNKADDCRMVELQSTLEGKSNLCGTCSNAAFESQLSLTHSSAS